MEHGELAGAPIYGDPRDAHRRDGARRRLLRDGVQDRRLARVQGGVPEGRSRSSSSRSWQLEVTAPDETVGAVNGDLNSRRGRLHGMEPAGGMTTIKAEVPMAEILTYAQALTSMTGGRGDYSMHFLRYEEVPTHVAQKIIEQTKREREEARSRWRTRQNDDEGLRGAEGRRDDGHVERQARLHRDGEVLRPAQEGEAVRRALLRVVRRGRRRRRRGPSRSSSTAGRARRRRTSTWARSARSASTSPPTGRCRRCRRSSSRTSRRGSRSPTSSSSTRSAPASAASSRTSEKKDDKGGGDAKKAEDEYFGPKRDLESLCEFMSALALRERPLGLADLHRGRELRRLPRRPAREDAAGGRRASASTARCSSRRRSSSAAST